MIELAERKYSSAFIVVVMAKAEIASFFADAATNRINECQPGRRRLGMREQNEVTV